MVFAMVAGMWGSNSWENSLAMKSPAPRTGAAACLESGASVDAVFCANGLLALGALMGGSSPQAFHSQGLRCYRLGESDIAAEIPPGLRTVGIDSAQLGKIVGEMLLNRLSKGKIAAPIRRVDLLVTHRASI